MTVPDNAAIDNPGAKRFELETPAGAAFADYVREPGRLVITHVETPPALRGQGVAGALMDGVCRIARERGLKISPLCAYARAYFQRRADQADLLA